MGGTRPTGIVTFLFTDIEGSTRYWEDRPGDMSEALRLHDDIVRSAIESHHGYVFTTAGDSFAAAFSTTADAAAAAITIQRVIAATDWPERSPIRVRVGLNTGEADERDGDYFGPPVNRAARLMSAAHGGQVLVSDLTRGMMPDADLVDLGTHRFKDLVAPQRVWQLAADGLTEDFPPITSLNATAHNLPVQRTELLGREAEIGAISTLLEQHRLVTLTGFGGTGKTRLALAVAADVNLRYPRGAFFVDLAPLTDGELVGLAALEAAGLSAESLSGAGSISEQAAHAIAGQDLLLVLDNCEHLIEDVVDYLDHLLDASDRPSILATSREALEIDGEHQYRVRPLDVDDDANPAVQLFVERAAAVGVTATADDPTVAAICRKVDGLPLAIELAAARAPMLGLAELESRLDGQLELLASRRRRRGRHRSLEALLAWSWDLLEPDQRTLLAQLGTFSGGWTLAAAERVCDGAPTVPSRLEALVSSSFVDRVGETDPARFTMLEPVRQFAVAQLEARPDIGDLRGRHLDWLVEMASARTAGEQITSATWAREVIAEFDNLRAGVMFALETDRADRAALLLGATTAASFDGGRTAEFDRMIAATLEAVTVPPARLWLAGAFNDISTGNHVRLAQRALQALSTANAEDDPHSEVMAGVYVAYASATIDPTRATELADSAVEQARQLDDPHILAITLAWSGAVALIAGDRDKAEELLDEGVHLVGTTDSLAGLHAHLGRFFAALDAGRTSLETIPILESACASAPDSLHVGSARIFRGFVFAVEGDRPEVEHVLGEALGVHEQFGIPNPVADASLAVAELLAHEGHLPEARAMVAALHRQALTTPMSYHRFRQLRDRVPTVDRPDRKLEPRELHSLASQLLRATA